MFGKLPLVKWPKEYVLFGGTLALTLLAILFFGLAPKSQPKEGPMEIGLSIPKGFVLIPIELNNAQPLSSLIHDQGIVDIFRGNASKAIVENLRIIKVHNEIGPVFGALVPIDSAGTLQSFFARKDLSGALKPVQSPQTVLRIPRQQQFQVSETLVQEESP